MQYFKINESQRVINIIQNALNHGFEFNEERIIEDIKIMAEKLLEKETEPIEEECEVTHRDSGQHVEWSDGLGYTYDYFGEIKSKKSYKDSWESPKTKIFHSECFDSEGNYVRLYEFLGENEYNVREGYFYCRKNKRHELKEDENN